MAILGVEAGAVDEVDTAANHVSCGECGTIGLASPGGTEGMPIIAMVTIGMFIPTCEGREQPQLSRGTREREARQPQKPTQVQTLPRLPPSESALGLSTDLATDSICCAR